ncbi:hypothetical protein MBEHAL_0671 [Halarchaeum acidiphilum MH1-52-1]|uniref:Uncharacterized protein n=1 Tax=Halarchaeum acidiphilum MH1-52-1 TaxID=1261545 RepID=U2YDX9_9EURY|nr:hypothetical protein [Halarchaeum acidiphilum]GAD51911.1 hypothetical protein MBEHAL_0671 [Halarchaeum acidiphilum MH1-52-1]
MRGRALTDETGHGALVVVALVALGVVVAVTGALAEESLRIVALSACYVGGVGAFWIGYWALRRRAAGRRERLLERGDGRSERPDQ